MNLGVDNGRATPLLAERPRLLRGVVLAAGSHLVAILALFSLHELPRATSSTRSSWDVELDVVEPAREANSYNQRLTTDKHVGRANVALATGSRARPIEKIVDRPSARLDGLTGAAGTLAAPIGSWSLRTVQGPDVLANRQVSLPPDSTQRYLPDEELDGIGVSLGQELADADVAKGLGRGGLIVLALEDVTRIGAAPVRGAATFEVVVEAHGSATVSLSEAESDPAAWVRLADDMTRAVSALAVRLRPGARRMLFTVRLDARLQWPSGQDAGPAKAFAQATNFELQKDSMVVKTVPEVSAGVAGKVCSASVHLGVNAMPLTLTGGCQPENIGAIPQRIFWSSSILRRPNTVCRQSG